MKQLVDYPHFRSNLIILPVWIVIFFSCSPEHNELAERFAGAPVQVTSPERRDMISSIDLNANTIFLKKEIVRATFPGFIEQINKNIGDKIRKGDLLLQIRTKESAANDSLTLEPEIFPGAIPVRARSDGVLTSLNYHTGDFISEGEEIAIISNPSALYITLNVPYQYVAGTRTHTRCQIILPDGNKAYATIEKQIPSVDPVSQTQTFLLRLVASIDLPENLNVTARLPLKHNKNALVLPAHAILSNETEDVFWIMKLIDDSTAVRVDIQKGIENDSLVQIIEPELDLSDRVISEGAYGLPDTASISLIR